MLPASLTDSPRPIYLLSSDEPLLLRDWLDEARASLAEQGFEDIQRHQVEAGFDWDALLQDGMSLSLFSSRRCLIIGLNSPRPGKAGAGFISRLCDHPPEDTVFIVVCPRLDATARNSAWVKTIKRVGEVCELNPVYPNQLVGWITQRAQQKGLALDPQAALSLADMTEGNLLASDQELEKLALSIDSSTPVGADQLSEAVSRSSRFTAYVLVDACLAGKGRRAIKVLRGLRQEGLQPVQALYPLQQALENLLQLKLAQQHNRLDRGAWQRLRIWASKQRLYSQALARFSVARIERLLRSCATLDRLSKGQDAISHGGDEWLALNHLVNEFSGLHNEETFSA